MENKTTIELLKVLFEKGTGSGDNYDQEIYESAFAELSKRSPFWEIFNEDYDESLPSIRKEVDEWKAETKALKRHKHDERTGDVMIRI